MAAAAPEQYPQPEITGFTLALQNFEGPFDLLLSLITQHELDITEVHRSPEGSARFPTIDPAVWAETRREPRDGFDFVGYRRVTS